MKGKIIIISGPSGAGKGTIAAELAKALPNTKVSVSVTSRKMRGNEQEGVSYYFITPERFDTMIEAGELLEYNRYVDHGYGTPKAPVVKMLEEGSNVILEIDVNGAAQVKEKYPDAMTFFLYAPVDVLVQRIENREHMSDDEINKRMETAKLEFLQSDKFDYSIENKVIEDTLKTIVDIIKK